MDVRRKLYVRHVLLQIPTAFGDPTVWGTTLPRGFGAKTYMLERTGSAR